MRVASHKGVPSDWESEVSGTAKVSLYEQKNEVVRSKKGLRDLFNEENRLRMGSIRGMDRAVKIAQHIEG